jgi:hypothetical protein
LGKPHCPTPFVLPVRKVTSEMDFVLVGAWFCSSCWSFDCISNRISKSPVPQLKIQLDIVFCFAFSLSSHLLLQKHPSPQESNPQIQLYYCM